MDARYCRGAAVTWDGLPNRGSSGRDVSAVQQLEAVAKRYLQHCFDDMGRDLKVPNNGEVLIQQLVQFGWLVWGGKHATNRRATAVISANYSAEPLLERMMNEYRKQVVYLSWQQQQQQQQQQKIKQSPKTQEKKKEQAAPQLAYGGSSQDAQMTGGAGGGCRSAAGAAERLGSVGKPTAAAPGAAAAAQVPAGVYGGPAAAAAAAATCVPATLGQLVDLFEAIEASDDQMGRLQAAAQSLQAGQQLQPEQQELFELQHKLLQAWVLRGRMDKVETALDDLLEALGV